MILFLTLLCAATTSFAQPLTLRYDKPAQFFEEALVIGNGSMGATVYGGYDTDRISLNDITLWTGEPIRNVFSPGAAAYIPAIREALDNEDYAKADQLQHQVEGKYTENYQPLGTLMIDYLGEDGQTMSAPVTDYVRTLDISSAVAATKYKRGGDDFFCEYIATAPDSVLVFRIKAPAKFNARIRLESQLPHQTMVQGNQIVSDGYVAYHSRPNYTDGKFEYQEQRGMRYRTVVKVMADNLYYPEGEAIRLKGNSDVLIFIANVTSFNGFDRDPVTEGRDYKTLVQKRIDRASKLAWAKLRKRHVADYQSFFNRVSLNLGETDPSISTLPTDRQLWDYTTQQQANPELEALYFQFGRYLLISCSRTIGVPANLQGLWNEHMLPPWSCNYTSNINLEENYWMAETANLSELHLPMLSFVKNLQKTGKTTAREYYGVNEGWCLGHNTDIWATTNPVGERSGSPQWACWNMGGAWVATHIWEHYMFTGDRRFLQEYYPVLKGAADFCLNWLIEKDGYLMTSPGTSPENAYRTDQGYQGFTLYGASADIAMIHECLADTREAAKVLGIDAKYMEQIDATIARLAPYKIGKKGNFQEWYHDWSDPEVTHRHQTHLFGLYPGHQFDSDVLPYQNYTVEQLRQACAKTLEIRGDNTTGWSAGWRVNLYARLRDAKNAYHLLQKLLNYVSPDNYSGPNARRGGGTYPNLLDAHSPFQIDGNFGGSAGVIEMLMQSTENTITLLPALPSAWRNGEVKGICARGGYEVDIKWQDAKVVSFSVKSKRGGQTTVKYNGTSITLKLKKNGERTVKA